MKNAKEERINAIRLIVSLRFTWQCCIWRLGWLCCGLAGGYLRKVAGCKNDREEVSLKRSLLVIFSKLKDEETGGLINTNETGVLFKELF